MAGREKGHGGHGRPGKSRSEGFSGDPAGAARAAPTEKKRVACWGCGGGDEWIKTCTTEEGERVRLCDGCWEALRGVYGLTIVPGDAVVAARCDRCWRYGNPRDYSKLRRNSGHADAYGGLCPNCSRSMAEGEDDGPRRETER